MPKNLVFLISLVSTLVCWVPSSIASEKRCGWLVNPTPANWWLTDRDGLWLISAQGGDSANGMENIPDISRGEYVTTNVHYGYACACLNVTTEQAEMKIVNISSFQQLPLATCREDPALPAMPN